MSAVKALCRVGSPRNGEITHHDRFVFVGLEILDNPRLPQDECDGSEPCSWAGVVQGLETRWTLSSEMNLRGELPQRQPAEARQSPMLSELLPPTRSSWKGSLQDETCSRSIPCQSRHQPMSPRGSEQGLHNHRSQSAAWPPSVTKLMAIHLWASRRIRGLPRATQACFD